MGEKLRRCAPGVALAACFLPALILLLCWGHLPATVPAHWSGDGVDRLGSKWEM